ncbi:hypothetical protein HZA97_00765 [Candidatus Woesearchaeota archaeon]|nr:hypothetical protein [Candidatus Woesearchaeota archaeon]
MNQNILGDKKKSSFDDNLADYVNAIFDREAELEKLKKAKEIIVPKPEIVVSNVSRVVYDLAYFNKLDIEVKAKEKLTFEESQRRLEKAGYERHLSFQEQIGLILLRLEGKLSGKLEETAENMLKPKSEWCNQLYNSRDENFIVVEEIINSTAMINQGLDVVSKYHRVKKFTTRGIILGNYNNLKNIHEQNSSLVEYLFTKPFAQLPVQIQKEGGLWTTHVLWPVARGFFNPFYIYGIEYRMASRGVRKKKEDKRFDEILK